MNGNAPARSRGQDARRNQRPPAEAKNHVGLQAVRDVGKLALGDLARCLAPHAARREQGHDRLDELGRLVRIFLVDECTDDVLAALDEALREPISAVHAAYEQYSHR